MRLLLDTGVLGQICTAAQLWAAQRRTGQPTGEGLDGDLLIVAQALDENAAIVTFNEKHFEAWVEAMPWSAVPLSPSP